RAEPVGPVGPRLVVHRQRPRIVALAHTSSREIRRQRHNVLRNLAESEPYAWLRDDEDEDGVVWRKLCVVVQIDDAEDCEAGVNVVVVCGSVRRKLAFAEASVMLEQLSDDEVERVRLWACYRAELTEVLERERIRVLVDAATLAAF
ncbi:MAG: hypothetical protein AAFV01_07225, partial [Bacteroidota bacterium]